MQQARASAGCIHGYSHRACVSALLQIFLLRSRDASHAQAADHDWVEDMEFSERLSLNWDLQIVREVHMPRMSPPV